MPKRIGDRLYYSVPEAAKEIGITRGTLFRWITQGLPPNSSTDTITIKKDPYSNHYLIAEEVVTRLVNRLEDIEVPTQHRRNGSEKRKR